jgi:hypothetical protein
LIGAWQVGLKHHIQNGFDAIVSAFEKTSSLINPKTRT